MRGIDMERLTRKLPDGSYEAAGRGPEEILAALGRFEDQYESLQAELELVKLNMGDLSQMGKARSATYATLAGSRFMLQDMLTRLDEPPQEVARRLEALRREVGQPEDDGFRDVED